MSPLTEGFWLKAGKDLTMHAMFRDLNRKTAMAALALAIALPCAPALAQDGDEPDAEQSQKNQQAELVLLRAKANLAKNAKLTKRKELSAAKERVAEAQRMYDEIGARANDAQADATAEPADSPNKKAKQTRALLLGNTTLVALDNLNKANAEQGDLESAVTAAEDERATLKKQLATRKRESLNQYMDRVKIEKWAQGILPRPIAAPRIAVTQPNAFGNLPAPPAGQAAANNAGPQAMNGVPVIAQGQLGGMFADPNLNAALAARRLDLGQQNQRAARAQAISRQQKARLGQLIGARPAVRYEQLPPNATPPRK